MRAPLVLAAIAAGCFDPDYPTGLLCSPGCPPGQTCNAAGVCEIAGQPDAAAADPCQDVTCTNDHGSTMCVGGACVPTCDEGFQDCNSQPGDGCETDVDENFDCATQADTTTIQGINADIPDMAMTSNYGEAFFKVRLIETDVGTLRDLTIRVDLQSQVDTDYDLYVTCDACDGAPAGTSMNGAGQLDRVEFGLTDLGPDAYDDLDLVIEVRHSFSASCALWTLTLTTDVATGARPCE